MSSPKVSVSIITYNAESYIQSVLDSVLSQEVDFEYEVIIGDDASSDNTKKILECYQEKYSNVFVIFRNANVGAAQNYLETLALCRGDYIAHLDGDDLMLPNKLQKQVQFLDNNNEYSAVFHNMRVFDNESGKTLRYYNSQGTKSRKNLSEIVKYGTGFCHSSKMFRASSIRDIEVKINTHVVFDWLMHIIHARHGDIGYIDEVLGEYRYHTSSVVFSNSNNIALVAEDLLKIIEYSRKFADEQVCQFAKARVKFERALRFLEIKDFKSFRLYLIDSVNDYRFLGRKHRLFYSLKKYPNYLRYIVFSYHKTLKILNRNHR